ncbi:PAS domain-containing protein [Aeromonas simiae]|uniref:PAS domain-containing protein n=1 Tax=Aeromonas simiae TaxID=218936 RepID=UPI0005A712A7|nr:PAS domain-containing protein [Aeromonas simiae]MDO2947209.1 PAS domain-containing protein [Aeromonas simiae]MDO2954836.1 PAS domain-containing protein [Aeromonas simiae]
MEIREFHWLMNIIQNLDVGLVILDTDYRIRVWNGFMESHSGRLTHEVQGGSLFELFPEVDRKWFERKANMVFKLNNRAFSTWEQKPYLLRFSNYRPITGAAPHMYQNLTLVPLADFDGEVTHIAIMIYDVTDEAMLACGKQ